MPDLSPSAYVVLGLLDQRGSTSPYALDRLIRATLGHFWSFPRSQLYAEAARLGRLGLVREEREEAGRRRRLLTLTEAGREEFRRWLRAPTGRVTELRDDGLLRLFLQPTGALDTAAVERLAQVERASHERQLALYEAMMTEVRPRATPGQLATLTLGVRFERLCVEFWASVEAGDPDVLPG